MARRSLRPRGRRAVPPALEHRAHGERVIGRYRWGLVPPWATELPKYPSHNARSETVAVKPTFRHAFRTQRAIVPADGYFEWQVIGSGKRAQKQPWYISPRRGPQLGFAGLYEFWRPPTAVPDDPWLASCTIVTTTPGPDVADIHDRQPVVLDRDAWDIWLDPTSDVEEVRGLLAPAPTGTFARHPVGSAVGSSRSDGPDLIAPVEPILVTS